MKKLFMVLGILLVIMIGLWFIFWKLMVYPPLHRFASSPMYYIQKSRYLLPEAAYINLKVIDHGSRKKPQIALTFDADMTPGMLLLLKSGAVKSWYNKDIKTILDNNNAKATVFLGGLWTKTYPSEALNLAKDPLIEIGNHSYNHYAFTTSCFSLPFLSDSEDKNDVETAQQIIKLTTGITPKFFRFPGGCSDSVDINTVAQLGLRIVYWDVVAMDGFENNPDVIVKNVERNVQNGSIIVFHIHDGSYAPKTAQALRIIIPNLKSHGFEFVKLSELEE